MKWLQCRMQQEQVSGIAHRAAKLHIFKQAEKNLVVVAFCPKILNLLLKANAYLACFSWTTYILTLMASLDLIFFRKSMHAICILYARHWLNMFTYGVFFKYCVFFSWKCFSELCLLYILKSSKKHNIYWSPCVQGV